MLDQRVKSRLKVSPRAAFRLTAALRATLAFGCPLANLEPVVSR